MRITTISYAEKRNLGDKTYENAEFRAEAVLEDGDNATTVALTLRHGVSAWLAEVQNIRDEERRAQTEALRRQMPDIPFR